MNRYTLRGIVALFFTLWALTYLSGCESRQSVAVAAPVAKATPAGLYTITKRKGNRVVVVCQ